jgi:putative DNA primase/helicase
MSIHNQSLTNLKGLDLGAFIKKYGPPHYVTRRNPVGSLNEVFWAALFASFNEIFYENREVEYYKYKVPDGTYPDGIFQTHSAHLLQQQLANDILYAAQNWSGYATLAQLRNSKHLSGIFPHLKGFIQKEAAFDRPRSYIHVQNGVIDLRSGSPKLIGFDPKLISRNSIPIEFKPGAGCQRFKDELLAPLSKDDAAVVQKLFGMYVLGRNLVQVIPILQGEAETGKSALAAVARELVGAHNCAELRTAHLEDRFEIGRYLGKILLIGADVAADFLNQPGAHRLKSLVGGDTLTGEMKFSNRRFPMLGIFNVLVTCNNRLLVRLDGDRGAWLRRLIILLYGQRKHLKNIPNFGYLLVQSEGSGILNWALEGLEMLNEEVATHGTLLLTPEQKNRAARLLDESDGLRIFVTENIVADKSKDLSSQEIIEKYASYCADQDRNWNINVRIVERQLPNLMMQIFRTASNNHIVRNNKQVRGYRYVTLAP